MTNRFLFHSPSYCLEYQVFLQMNVFITYMERMTVLLVVIEGFEWIHSWEAGEGEQDRVQRSAIRLSTRHGSGPQARSNCDIENWWWRSFRIPWQPNVSTGCNGHIFTDRINGRISAGLHDQGTWTTHSWTWHAATFWPLGNLQIGISWCSFLFHFDPLMGFTTLSYFSFFVSYLCEAEQFLWIEVIS